MSQSNIRRRDLLKSAATLAALPALAAGCTTATAQADRIGGNSTDKRSDYFDGPDGQVHYWTAGSGPDLLMIHQSNNSSEEYTRLIPYLSKHFRMIAFDLPGHGNSDDPSSQHELDKIVEVTIALTDHLRAKKFHVVGHHGGALVALNLVRLHPQRVMKTILSGSSGPKTPEEAAKFKNKILKRAEPFDWDGDAIANTWDRYVKLRSDDGRIEDLMASYLTTTKTKLRPYNIYNTFLNWDRSSSIEALTGPVLLIKGGKDEFVSHQERLLKLIPNSQRKELPGCGVFMFYERPKDCAMAINDFLQQGAS